MAKSVDLTGSGLITPYQTCHRRFRQWVRGGALKAVLEALGKDLRVRGELDLSGCFIDATFILPKKRGLRVGKTKRGKGTKLMAVADRFGLPLAVHAASAAPHEVSLVGETLAEVLTAERPAS